jgi:acetylornithine deacetylase/succinyl-diaminopimelate desuccinylase-like protein
METGNEKRIAAARRRIRALDATTLDDMQSIVKIPAPPFGETERGAFVADLFRSAGLEALVDEVGNVIATPPGSTDVQSVILSAHLDTVFPAETPIEVRKNGTRILAPGISDNARGLAAMMAIARVVQEQQLKTRLPVTFVATVGEEGLGDLRGVKHLFRAGSPYRNAAAFISLDGTGRRRIVYRAIGSRRLRVTIHGPGGHSWADWGMANAVHAMGLGIGGVDQLDVPRQPRSSLTVGRVGGGTSVNAVPAEAWCEVDVRSEAANLLVDLETSVRETFGSALDHINTRRKRGTAALTLDIRVIGDRPSGETPVNSPVVRAARSATRAFGDTPELVASSTDANIPIALGIPAIALGAGGESGGTHTVDEWYSNEGGPEGIERALLIVLEVAGLV